MSYTITKSDGSILATIVDGHYDNSTSLTLPGRNLANFGQLQNENYVYLLENFAKTTAPINVLTGQLWYDKSSNVLKVFDSTSWQPLAVISTSSSVASSTGNLWFDTTTGQLSVNNGSGFSIIGPEQVSGYGVTRLVSTKLQDISSVYHPVIECIINDEVVSIISNTAFSVNAGNAISGFPAVVRGITLKSGNTSDVTMYGQSLTAANANTLLNEAHNGYIAAATTASANTVVQRDGSGYITANGISTPVINATSGAITGNWQISGALVPSIDNTYNLGTNVARWSRVSTEILDAITVTANAVNYISLTDAALNSINSFDLDGTLVANSNSRLPTQRAVKTYVDAAIVNVQTTVTNVQNQVAAFVSNASTGTGANTIAQRDGSGQLHATTFVGNIAYSNVTGAPGSSMQYLTVPHTVYDFAYGAGTLLTGSGAIAYGPTINHPWTTVDTSLYGVPSTARFVILEVFGTSNSLGDDTNLTNETVSVIVGRILTSVGNNAHYPWNDTFFITRDGTQQHSYWNGRQTFTQVTIPVRTTAEVVGPTTYPVGSFDFMIPSRSPIGGFAGAAIRIIGYHT
jgi:hypothetical protein